jgi:hypothetical protein
MASELKTVDSMPGSINELISQKNKLRRPPSLSESFAWTPENVARAAATPLLTSDLVEIPEEPKAATGELKAPVPSQREQYICEIFIKLLLHITLISVFETLFYFLYVSSLENNGIIKTVNTFVNGATKSCENMTAFDIEIVDALLDPFINSTQIISDGNAEELIRTSYNKGISNQAWGYVGAMMGIFALTSTYIKYRKIPIKWGPIIAENVAMVCLLALYELMFFDTIIYPYEPISAKEIARNAVERLQGTCGLLQAT